MAKTNAEIHGNAKLAKLVSRSQEFMQQKCVSIQKRRKLESRRRPTEFTSERKKATRGSCSTATHINREGRGTHVVWTGIYFRSGSGRFLSLFPFFRSGETGARFSIFAGPRNPAFHPSFSLQEILAITNENRIYVLIRLMSLFCTIQLCQPSLLFKIGRRYRRRFVTLLDIFCRPRNRKV